jgi:hypothetical protein
MTDHPLPSERDQDTRIALHLLFAIARVWGVSVEVFMHRDLGVRYPGWPGAAVLLFVPLYGCFWEGHDLRPLVLFLAYFLIFCFVHRYAAWKRGGHKRPVHSYYNGKPVLCVWFRRLPELSAKQTVEPVLIGLLGILIAQVWNPPLGWYLVGAALSLTLLNATAQAVRKMQALDIHDAMIEQELLVECFRELQGEDF